MYLDSKRIDYLGLTHVINTSPLTVTSDTLITDAIALMINGDTKAKSRLPSDYVLVTQAEKLKGIFTQEDVLKLTLNGKDLSHITITSVMEKKVIKLQESALRDISTEEWWDRICFWRSLMNQHKIRHLPVVDEQDNLIGIITESSLLNIIDSLENNSLLPTPPHETDSDLERQICQLQQENSNYQQEIQSCRQIEAQIKFQANILAQVNDAVIAIDNEHCLIYCNQQAQKQYNINSNEYLGRPLTDTYVYRWLNEQDRSIASENLTNYGYWRGENIHIKNTGEEIYVELSISLLRNDSSEKIGSLAVIRDITERKQTEEKLRRTEASLQEAQRVAKISSWSWDLSTNQKWRSQDFYQSTNPNQNSSIPDIETANQFVHPEDKERVEQLMQAAIEEGIGYETEFRFLRPNQTVGYAFSCGRIERNARGEIVRFYGISKDVSRYKQVEEALRSNKQLYCSVIKAMHEGVVVQDADGNIITCNASAESILGLATEQIKGRNSLDPHWSTIHEDGSPFPGEFHPAMVSLRTGEACLNTVMGVYKPNGQLTWILINSEPLLHPGDTKPRGVVTSFSDITESRQAQAALQESEARFRSMADTAPMMIWVAGKDKLCNYFNASWLEFTGHSLEEEVNNGWLERVHPDDREHCLNIYTNAFDTHQPFSMEYHLLRYDNEYRWMLNKGTPRFDADGNFAGYIGSCIDITEKQNALRDRKEAEEKIAEQAALLDVATDAILLRSLNSQILYYNQGAQKIYGWSAEEVIGKSANDILYKELSPRVTQALNEVIKTGSWNGELDKVTKEGREIIVASRWTLIYDKSGKPKSILTVDTDITEKKQLESQFLRTQRLESLGTLASGIAHDLNNILTPILAVSQILPLKLSNLDSRSIDLLKMVENSAKRGADLVKQILSFARGDEAKRTVIQIKHLLKDIEKFAKGTFPKSIEIERNSSSDLWTISADPTQLHQVFMNLVVNARDAMSQGGTLSISAQNILIDQNYARMNIDAKVGSYVVITIADTGVGIPQEFIDRIFDPFFTTKEVGKGTGLGLSTVLGITKNHGGFIEISSEIGKGTKFKVYLPSQQGTAVKTVQNPQPFLGNGELILVVDDEDGICEIINTTLSLHNLQVLTAKDGIEGISLYAVHKDKIKLVLLDMMMPEMDGATAIHTLQRMNPEVKIIAMSGLTSTKTLAQAAGSGVQDFLSKPFTANELLETLAATLSSRE
ncbi:MAG: PAS domain S-box protein [Cyanobacteria bacterium P01_A01_bin.84]